MFSSQVRAAVSTSSQLSGIAAASLVLTEMGVSHIQPFVDVNAYGQLEPFKAVAPLLRGLKRGAPGKFVYMSSLEEA